MGDGLVTCPSCGQRTATDRGRCWWCDGRLGEGTGEVAPEPDRPTKQQVGCLLLLVALLLLSLAAAALIGGALSTWPV
jgi:hypothetical protein